MDRRVLISGAGIAGQVAGFWLAKAGWDVGVIERFDDLRTGGQNVDIRGAARTVIERMGLADRVSDMGTGEVGTRFVDERDRSLAEFPEDGSAGGGGTAEWEILRGQLTELFYDTSTPEVSYRFGTSIKHIEDVPGVPVRVTFASGEMEEFAAVVLAEGVGSRTRQLSSLGLGGGAVMRPLGVTIGYFSIDRLDTDDQWWRWYNTAGGRSATLRPDNLGRTRVTLSFRNEPVGSLDDANAKSLLRNVFPDAGWQCARILDQLDDVNDLYLDDIAQVVSPKWTSGRVAIVGDAAYCPSPVTGMGTTLAIVGAYVLAGELTTVSDAGRPFGRYEHIMRPYVERAQKLPLGAPKIMHPTSRVGVTALRTAFRLAGSGLLRPFERRLFHPPADTFTPPTYTAFTTSGQ